MNLVPAHILVVEDNPAERELLAEFLRHAGPIVGFADADTVVERAGDNSWQLVILGLLDSGPDRLARLSVLRSRRPDLPVLTTTDSREASVAVAAMKAGAYDHLVKPLPFDAVGRVVSDVVTHQRLIREIQFLRSRIDEREKFDELIGRSAVMREVFDRVAVVSDTDVPVLIVGEYGTGRELIARAIHHRSARSGGPFAVAHCSGLPDDLVASELFGHERGAFPGATTARRGRLEDADGGTLYLDEVAVLAPKAQADLLAVIHRGRFQPLGDGEERHADVRLVAATSRDLAAEVRGRRFRGDLHERLGAVVVRVPPLRERREDIPLLAGHFLEHFAQRMDRRARVFAPDAMALLLAHDWPGNVRELAQAIERAVAVGQGSQLEATDLPIQAPPPQQPGEGRSLQEVERRHIEFILGELEWNISRSAATLGIDRVTLYNKIKRYGLRRPPAPRSR
ncbi:MAG: sigma-54-dependent Fis family transcriptional regulator [Deltaproteobacteria bacterium]|nr:sigma-54-dependent Fis family transcriptional regulator [Deltaproteobacteria bacterium]